MYNKTALPRRLRTEACLAARVRRVHRGLVRMYDDRLRELGMTVAQLDILVSLLHQGDPLRPTDLARMMVMDRSTVSRNLARMAAQGLIQTTTGEGKREQWIRVTAKGRGLVARAEALWGEAQDTARNVLGRKGVEALELLSHRVGEEA